MDNFIFGLRPVYEAIKAGKTIEKVLVKNNLKGEFVSEIFKEIKKQNILIQHVPVQKLNKICNANHQGIIAFISNIEYFKIGDIIDELILKKKNPVFLILDGITDVRNFGAIARTAECAGIDALIIPSSNSASVTQHAIKTSAGALFNIKVCKENNLIDTVYLLEQYGFKVFAVTEKATKLIYDFKYQDPIALVLGSEDKGISKQLLKRLSNHVKIPMFGKTESLNVSVSAAIAIYEVVRQRL